MINFSKSDYKVIKTNSWLKALKMLKLIGVPIVLTTNMKFGSTYNITVKHFPKEYLKITNLDSEVAIEEVNVKPSFEKASKFYEDYPNDEAKRKLELYARSFDIELKVSKSFTNMMKDFKEAYHG